MNVHDAIRAYVAEVSAAFKAGNATEHSYRGFLQRLLETLLPPGWRAVNEPKRCECGAPDYAIMDKAGAAVAFVEAKDVGDADLDGRKKTGHKEQFDRYKAALDTIVFTDYLDFRLYVNGEFASGARIGEQQPGGRVRAMPEGFAAFLEIVDAIATAAPRKIDGSKALAAAMAAKARMLQVASLRFLSRGSPGGTGVSPVSSGDSQLFDLLRGFRDMLDPDIGEEEFSDIFAQTVTYGMFAARLRDPTPEDFSREEAAALIPKSNPFLKQLFFYIQASLEEELEWAVEDLVDLYRTADVGAIMRDYGAAQGGADPMIHFYEDFLAAYDAGLRKDRGVWYTPLPVVKFIVRAVDWTLRNRFGLPDGIADASKTQIEVEEDVLEGKQTVTKKVAKTVHRVQLLDPATGTGTFLAECAAKVRRRVCAANAGMWPGYAKNDLLPRLNGFELLMASYTMAHIKMDFAMGGGGGAGERFRIFLTDSLSDWHRELPGGLFAAALAQEQKGADEIKRDIPVMVVLGNPPYSGESQNKGEWIMRLMEDYKVEPGGKTRLQERNPKWLNDDYVKFVRLAEHYVEKNGSGIVAFITPHGFLDNPTFRGMRWRLMQTFDELYFLNLHGNAKKKETAPDGGKDENVFDIMQGVCISIMVKTPGGGAAACSVHYADVWGRRKKKFRFLNYRHMDEVKWQTLAPTEPMLFFVPRDTSNEDEYNKGFRIDELMPVNSTGVVSANDELNFSFSEDEQRKKIADLLSLPENEWRRKFNRANDSRDWKYSYARADAVRDGYWCKVAYRPFDARDTFYTGTQKGLYTNPRAQIMQQFLRGENVGLIIGRAGQVVKEDEWSLVHCADRIVDYNVFYRGGGCVFPLYLYEERLGGEGGYERRANLDAKIVERIAAAAGGADSSVLEYYRSSKYGETWYDPVAPEEILSLEPIPVTPDPTIDRKKAKAIFRAMEPVVNLRDGLRVRFPIRTAGKFIVRNGPNVLHLARELGRLFEQSHRAWSERPADIENHKVHLGIVAHHNYIAKVSWEGSDDLFVRFSIRSTAEDRHEVHDAIVSNIVVYKTGGIENRSVATSIRAPKRAVGATPTYATIVSHGPGGVNRGKAPFIDRKLALYLSVAKGMEGAKRDAAAQGAAALAPQDVFDYVYGVLHSPGYRRKYREFLKTDFPRVPYPAGAADFARFREAGRKLREAHLMKDPGPGIADKTAAFPVAGGNTVEEARYEAGRVHINETQYFDNVPEGVWGHFIGGYQPAQKWLKDRKGRSLSNEDVGHYRHIVAALAKTRETMETLP